MARFVQVDVFGSRPFGGNPLAVVLDADGLCDDRMQEVARWTGLSETTFLLPATDPGADYRVRIFTPGGELPFAGHPTLGSAHAWLEAGGSSHDGVVVQQCGAGLVSVRVGPKGLAFAAPPLRRGGPLDEATLARCLACLGIDASQVVAHAWGDNGPPWAMVLLADAALLQSLRPAVVDARAAFPAGIALTPDKEWAYEVRAFMAPPNPAEDPVTGSLNAAAAMWLRSRGAVPAAYTVRQGMQVGAAGEISVSDEGERIWIGGQVSTVVSGTITL